MSASAAEGSDPVGEHLDREEWADLGRDGQERILAQRLEDSDTHDPSGAGGATGPSGGAFESLDPREQLNTMAAIQDYVEHETWTASLLGGAVEMEFRVITAELGSQIEAIQDVIREVETAEDVEAIDEETIDALENTEGEFHALLADATADPAFDEAFWAGERDPYPDILETEAIRRVVDRHNSKGERIEQFRGN